MSEEDLLQLVEVDCAADPLFIAMDQSKRKEFAKSLASRFAAKRQRTRSGTAPYVPVNVGARAEPEGQTG
eukprot:9181443-Heterocapsa_arctica.AAC.1